LEAAGLLHDIGHGPFSHLFEEFVQQEWDPSWTHEAMGLRLATAVLDRHLSADRMMPEDKAFILLLLKGLSGTDDWPCAAVTGGRPASKRFLVDLVHNQSCGLDVDRLDYLLRDSLAVFGATHAVDVTRVISALLVTDDRLTFDPRIVLSLDQAFDLRTRLHLQVYQHREVLVVEHLVSTMLRTNSRAWLPTKLHDNATFCAINDASVLACMSARQRCHLYCRPRMHRIASLDVNTDPRCASCGAATDIRDAFCSACGTSTANRKCARVPFGGGQSVCVPQHCTREFLVIAEAILDAKFPSSGLHLFVCDVKCGVSVIVSDPHGTAWRGVRAADAVKFAPTGTIRASSNFCPGRHLMTVHCFSDQVDRFATDAATGRVEERMVADALKAFFACPSTPYPLPLREQRPI
jgi:hypothetical protein